jgi:hypothetical protein
MWERHASDDVIEFPMTVTSVEVPDPGWRDPGERKTTAVGAEPVDHTLMPRQGTGTWPNGERAVRLGHAEEILITLASKPFEAMDVARLSGVFDPPIRGLRVDLDSRRDGDFEVSWNAALHTAPLRWRAASLRLYASPSLNVTVLTIVPNKARTVSSRLFVRFGLRAARQLGAAIERQLAMRQLNDS